MKKIILLCGGLLMSTFLQAAPAKSPLVDVCWAKNDSTIFEEDTKFNCNLIGEYKLTITQIYELGYKVVSVSTVQGSRSSVGVTMVVEKRKL